MKQNKFNLLSEPTIRATTKIVDSSTWKHYLYYFTQTIFYYNTISLWISLPTTLPIITYYLVLKLHRRHNDPKWLKKHFRFILLFYNNEITDITRAPNIFVHLKQNAIALSTRIVAWKKILIEWSLLHHVNPSSIFVHQPKRELWPVPIKKRNSIIHKLEDLSKIVFKWPVPTAKQRRKQKKWQRRRKESTFQSAHKNSNLGWVLPI